MTTYTYDTSLPGANDAPRNDQPGMQINTSSISGLISEDHIGFNVPNGGFHKIVHQPTGPSTQNLTRSGVGAIYANTPANIVGVNQVIAGLYTPDATVTSTDTQLFNITGQGLISQLTASLTTDTITSDGWQWVGAVLLQWGFVSSTSSGTSKIVIFKDRITGAIPFPNNCFFVGATLLSSNAVTPLNIFNSGITIVSPSVTKDGFTCVFSSTAGGTGKGFYWFAIGN